MEDLHPAQWLLGTVYFIPSSHQGYSRCYLPPWTDEETEAQSGSRKVTEQAFHPYLTRKNV